jgi:hypothetical protein
MPVESPNGFNPDQLSNHLRIIDEADDELASLLGTYRADCKGPRARVKNAMAMAKDQGINMTAFRELVAAHRAQRKIEKRVADLEADDHDDFQAMVEALGEFGDTPLGAAAINRAKKPRGEEALNTLT